MSIPQKWAVREAANVTFYDLITDEVIVTLDTLKMTDVETTGETTYAQGGRGNAKVAGFSSDRAATVTLQDAVFDNAALAMLTGNEVSSGAKTIKRYDDMMLDGDGKGNLLLSPATGEDSEPILKVYELLPGGVRGDEVTGATVEGKELTASTAKNKMVRAYYDTVLASGKNNTITVTANNFGGEAKLVADVLVRDINTGKDFYGQFIAYKAKLEDDFSFSFSPDGDPSVLDIGVEILKNPANTTMWELVIYDGEDD